MGALTFLALLASVFTAATPAQTAHVSGVEQIASISNYAFSMQVGGGVDVPLKSGFGLRVPELDYVHSTLPNNAGNSQNDFRLAFGVSYRK